MDINLSFRSQTSFTCRTSHAVSPTRPHDFRVVLLCFASLMFTSSMPWATKHHTQIPVQYATSIFLVGNYKASQSPANTSASAGIPVCTVIVSDSCVQNFPGLDSDGSEHLRMQSEATPGIPDCQCQCSSSGMSYRQMTLPALLPWWSPTSFTKHAHISNLEPQLVLFFRCVIIFSLVFSWRQSRRGAGCSRSANIRLH